VQVFCEPVWTKIALFGYFAALCFVFCLQKERFKRLKAPNFAGNSGAQTFVRSRRFNIK
jgi:hypothetical protein